MKVLITGATGLVGRAIVAQCLKKNWKVHYLSTSQGKLDQIPDCKGFYWDLQSGYIDEECLSGVDTVIHLAGASISGKWTAAYKEEILNSRVISTRMLFRLLKNHPHNVKQIVAASAMGIYPHDYFKTYTEEDVVSDNSFLSTVVEKWEEETGRFESLSIKTAKVRIGVVLSLSGGALSEMIKPIKNGYGAVIGCGEQWISWIHINDLAGIFIKLAEDKKTGIYNGVAPQPVTNQTMTHQLAKVLGKKIWLPPVPAFVLKILLGERATLVLSSIKVSAKKIENCGYAFQFPDLESALNDLIKK